ncbi:sigma-70 family RNA polymerase sigma factor [Spongiactinospora sp. TRM90649]|uniref:RNA polymerase sigma factor n=1 Tax=Spongiactinospora sp. TRM90649 TaxID=3031114 RepID=UPI0023F6D40A|nr:sigma-70 family RNA polymerase sigma factor [Spongiactinospora sp. TRM90649]MDF5754447.1 sigma-70 family RNA polymerase sigma factor [Spongiactinospora sp. TRM90649]
MNDTVDPLDTLNARLAAGEADALGDCYRANAALVRGYLRRFVQEQELDDVVQIVFGEAWRSRHRFDPSRSLAAWLLGIAHKRAVDHLRARRPPTLPLEAVPDTHAHDGPAADDRLAMRDELHAAMARLPRAQRQAIELAYYGEFTQREIAERLRVPLGTVKARTTRGLHRLSVLLSRPAS